jgi:hypothetical protein
MKPSSPIVTIALCLSLAAPAGAGAPQPEQRQGDFAHVCKGGPNKDLACTVATQDVDCPRSECVVQALTKTIKGELTIIAHDGVTDWSNSSAGNQALTVLLEVKGPDGTRELLAATYQNLAAPDVAPTAPGNVVAIDMDEFAVQTLAESVGGLAFAQSESALAERLQTLFGSTGTPAIVDVLDRKVDHADHTTDGLATVLRFTVKIQFLAPL